MGTALLTVVACVVTAWILSHAVEILLFLGLVLLVLGVGITAAVLLMRRLARSRVCMVSRPGLPPASPRTPIAAPAAPGRGRLPAPVQVKAIGPPARQVVPVEIVREVRREA